MKRIAELGLCNYERKIEEVYLLRLFYFVVYLTINVVSCRYWIYNRDGTLESGPNPITNLGLPASMKKIDAAFVYGSNRKTYFYSVDKYWRYNEEEGRMDSDYPRSLSVWGDGERKANKFMCLA